uniref:NADH-ubiquinone oxidoreductase chain 4 n=1 Tax=Hydroptila sp. XG-2021 TaxID=2996735 RepID=A0A9E8LQ60_9NEOP|nr:NADH dehydrogenase subunit 4 [Hydroptila sp. XG-2021]
MLKLLVFLFFMIPMVMMKLFFYCQIMMFLSMFFMLIFSLNMNYFISLSYIFNYDIISYILVILSVWLVVLMYMVSYKIFKLNISPVVFNLVLLFLLLFLILTFSVNNMFMFYLFFECSLIPVFLLVIGWGYQPERLKAGIYLLFYTLIVSLPLMIGIFYVFHDIKSLSFFMMSYFDKTYFMLYLVMNLSFLVKMPMFLVHLWLPRAHVESPVSGSMILAGVMLKLGGYGLIRLLLLVQSLCVVYGILWGVISLVGGLVVSFYCLNQMDMKMIVAYSSVVHMSFVLVGLMSMTYWGVYGAFLVMVGHGLCSSGLFVLVNIVYERFHSRNMFISKGLLMFMPSFSMFWFLLLSSNMSAPLSLNLLGEISLIFSMIFWSGKFMLVVMMIMFFSACYSLYLFMFSQSGKFNFSLFNFSSGQVREFLTLILHWLPLNLMFLHLDLFLI